MNYTVEILRKAQKQLSRIERTDRDRIIEAVESLVDNPRPPGCKRLSGRPAWRIRIGPYRVIYKIHDARLLVLVVEIGHRREVYR